MCFACLLLYPLFSQTIYSQRKEDFNSGGFVPSANGSQQMTGGGTTSEEYTLLLKPFLLD